MKKNVFAILLFLVPVLSNSQSDWEGGVFLGYSNYLGDMVEPTITFDQANPAAGVFLRNHLSDNFGLRANLFFGKIEGADANYERLASRGASFEATLTELSLQAEFDVLGHKRWDEDGKFKRQLSPFVFGGVGLALVNADIDLNEIEQPSAAKTEDLRADFSDVQLALPVGFGLKYDVSPYFNLGLEGGMRLTFADYLDGISVAGDPGNNDIYIFGGLTAGLRVGARDRDNDGVADKKDKCPLVPGLIKLEGCPDADLDGVTDSEDKCPNTAGSVRFDGCPDFDGDGVPDPYDDCPEDAGLKRLGGCPDTDGDGIVDKEDNCPEVAGIPPMNGCPDADRDGVRDDRDRCPNEPGLVTLYGCPDRDSDGVIDSEDGCPNLPGPAVFNGCPDTDRDGVYDPEDKCPEVPGSKANAGCPEIKKEDKETLDFAMQNVRFETGNAILTSASLRVLDEVVKIMERYPGYGLSIAGYTDNVGNQASNRKLSEERAKACLDYLVSKGVSATRLTAAGYGESNPIGDNSTQRGREMNRRVEFTLNPM